MVRLPQLRFLELEVAEPPCCQFPNRRLPFWVQVHRLPFVRLRPCFADAVFCGHSVDGTRHSGFGSAIYRLRDCKHNPGCIVFHGNSRETVCHSANQHLPL